MSMTDRQEILDNLEELINSVNPTEDPALYDALLDAEEVLVSEIAEENKLPMVVQDMAAREYIGNIHKKISMIDGYFAGTTQFVGLDKDSIFRIGKQLKEMSDNMYCLIGFKTDNLKLDLDDIARLRKSGLIKPKGAA